jgi:hypothetical protein
MLNLSIAMLRYILVLMFLFQNPVISISSPLPGTTLRGQVEILGNMDVPNFASAELALGYFIPNGGAADPADNWFPLQSFSQPKVDAPLMVWDTTSVTDGEYNLRLRVFLQDGSFQDATVNDLKLRNDLPEPTETPQEFLQAPTQSSIPVKPTSTSTVIFPRPTPLPPNPAGLTTSLIFSNLTRGSLIAFVIFVAFSILLRLRKNQNS